MRLRMLLEHFGDHLHRDLRRDFAMKMTAHTVRYHHEYRVFAVGISQPILVIFAAALAALLENGKFHGAALKNFFGQGLAYGVE